MQDHHSDTQIIIKNFLLFIHQVLEWVERVWVLETKINKKSNFYKDKKIFKIDDIDVNKILEE